MTTPLQNSIIAASSIGSLLSNYNHNETNKNIKKIKSDIKKLMYKRSRSNEKEFKEAISIADTAWKNTINHFVKLDKKLAIEALYSVMKIHDLYSAPLTRFANISDKKIEKIMFNVDVSIEHETNTHTAMNYYLDLLAESTGVKRRVNPLKTRAYAISQDIIIERG